jgi:hypothetical protein
LLCVIGCPAEKDGRMVTRVVGSGNRHGAKIEAGLPAAKAAAAAAPRPPRGGCHPDRNRPMYCRIWSIGDVMMKSGAFFAVIALAALGSAFGISRLEAQPNSLLDFCPASHGNTTDCATAARMFLDFTKPSDDTLIEDVNAIADAARSGKFRHNTCGDAAAAIELLAGAIKDQSTRDLALNLGAALCGGTRNAAAGPHIPDPTNLAPTSPGGNAGTSGQNGASGGTSGSTSGTSGQTSSSGGASGGTSSSSGTSGQTSSSGGTG